MIVYSANFGDKDKLKEPEINSSWSKDLKFVYFTDQEFESPTWNIIVENTAVDTVRKARWYKMHSHELFPGELTLWVDANLIVQKDPTELIGDYSLFTQEHPYRFCLYEEADYCIRKKRGNREDIERQVEYYKKQHYPECYGLYTTRILLRQSTEKVKLLNKQWWEHIVMFSTRDQISLPYVLWKYGIRYDTLSQEELKVYFYKRGGHKWR